MIFHTVFYNTSYSHIVIYHLICVVIHIQKYLCIHLFRSIFIIGHLSHKCQINSTEGCFLFYDGKFWGHSRACIKVSEIMHIGIFTVESCLDLWLCYCILLLRLKPHSCLHYSLPLTHSCLGFYLLFPLASQQACAVTKHETSHFAIQHCTSLSSFWVKIFTWWDIMSPGANGLTVMVENVDIYTIMFIGLLALMIT